MKYFAFEISRISDLEIDQKVRAALNGLANIARVSAAPLSGGELKDDQLTPILEVDSIFILSFSYIINDQLQIRIARPHSDQKLKGWTDEVQVTFNEQNADAKQISTITRSLREHLPAIDTQDIRSRLTEDEQKFYAAREQSLRRLQEIQDNFFDGLHKFTLKQTEETEEFRKELERKSEAKLAELETLFQQRKAIQDERDAKLDEREKTMDILDSKASRRKNYEKIKQHFKDLAVKYELTVGTQNRRRAVFWQASPRDKDGVVDYILLGRQAFVAFLLVATIGLFIGWNNQWFKQHADEEFRLKRFEIDIDRANWAVEQALEWTVDGGQIPPHLLEQLTKNLFIENRGGHDDPLTAGEVVANAIFGASSNVKLKQGDTEMTIGRQGIKKLNKTAIDDA